MKGGAVDAVVPLPADREIDVPIYTGSKKRFEHLQRRKSIFAVIRFNQKRIASPWKRFARSNVHTTATKLRLIWAPFKS